MRTLTRLGVDVRFGTGSWQMATLRDYGIHSVDLLTGVWPKMVLRSLAPRL